MKKILLCGSNRTSPNAETIIKQISEEDRIRKETAKDIRDMVNDVLKATNHEGCRQALNILINQKYGL